MQKLLVALKEFSMDEIKAIRKLDGYSFRVHGKNDPKYIVWSAYQRDLDYAISIAPKTYRFICYLCDIKLKTERPNRLEGKNNKKLLWQKQ